LGRALAIAGALFCAAILGQPGRADAALHGGGGFHGGGFHGGYHGWHGGYGGFGLGLGLGFGLAPLAYGWGYYPYDGYYGYSEPYPAQTWYYCSNPPGYYPYVTQCSTGWQAVPAS
jgi:hypothetical protein